MAKEKCSEPFPRCDVSRRPFIRPPWCRERVFAPEGDGTTMTQQQFRDQTNVNEIVARFERTGMMPPGRRDGQYGDVSMLHGSLIELASRAQDIVKIAKDFAEGWVPPTPELPPEPTPQAVGEPPAA